VSVEDQLIIEEFNPGTQRIQPHNFVLIDGKDLSITPYAAIKMENNFAWINSSVYGNVTERRYVAANGSNIVINSRDADLKLSMLHGYNMIKSYNAPRESIYFLGYKNDPLSRLMHLSSLGNVIYVLSYIRILILKMCPNHRLSHTKKVHILTKMHVL